MRQLGPRLLVIFSGYNFRRAAAIAIESATTGVKPPFKLQEVMIPVRDGVRLQTAILTPVDQQGPLPILFRRTPYGVPEKPPEQMPTIDSKSSRKTATSS